MSDLPPESPRVLQTLTCRWLNRFSNSIGEAAERLGVSRQALSAVLNGRAGVSAETALHLAQALGTSAEMWLSMQVAHDLWKAEKARPKAKRIAT